MSASQKFSLRRVFSKNQMVDNTYSSVNYHILNFKFSALLISFIMFTTIGCFVVNNTETKMISFIGFSLPGNVYQTQSFIWNESGEAQFVKHYSDGRLIELISGHTKNTSKEIEFPKHHINNSLIKLENKELITDSSPSRVIVGHSKNNNLIQYSSELVGILVYEKWINEFKTTLFTSSSKSIQDKYFLQVLPSVAQTPAEISISESKSVLFFATQKLFLFYSIDEKSQLFSLLTNNRKNIYNPIIVVFNDKRFVFNIYRIS
jgi:hypothetical protein